MKRVLIHLYAMCSIIPCAGSIELSLEEISAYVRANNRDLVAARWRIAEADGRLQQAGKLENPELEGEFAPNTRGSEYAFRIAFMLRFPLTSRLQLEKDFSRSELDRAKAEVEDEERRMALQTEIVAVKVLALAEEKRLKEKQVANSLELEDTAARLAQRGEASYLEVDQFILEAQEISIEILQIESALAGLFGDLRPLLGVEGSETIDITGALAAPRTPTAQALDPSARPDYRAAELRLQAAEKAFALAKANRLEDGGLGVFAEFERSEDAPEGLEDETVIGFSFSLPLPLWNRNEGAIRASEATVARSRDQLAALALRMQSEVEAARLAMTTTAHQHDTIQANLLPAAEALEERFRSAQRRGEASLTDMFRAREKRLQLEASRIRALLECHLARIRLQFALGPPQE